MTRSVCPLLLITESFVVFLLWQWWKQRAANTRSLCHAASCSEATAKSSEFAARTIITTNCLSLCWAPWQNALCSLEIRRRILCPKELQNETFYSCTHQKHSNLLCVCESLLHETSRLHEAERRTADSLNIYKHARTSLHELKITVKME